MKKSLLLIIAFVCSFFIFSTQTKALEIKQVSVSDTVSIAADCSTFFKNNDGSYNSTYYLLKNAFKIIKYAAVCMVLGFSIYDFVKAVASSDEGEIKKAIKTSIKRLIIGVFVFFLPVIIEFVLGIIGDFTTCDIL